MSGKFVTHLTLPVREKDEYAFLPAHLELIETPVSRRSHFVIWSILLFVIISLFLLSVLGKVRNSLSSKW